MLATWLLFVSTLLAAPATKHPGITKVSEREYVVETRAMNESAANLNVILQSARMVPYLEGKKFSGFQFLDIADDSVFKALGFRKGDVLKQVNDIVFDNPAKGFMAFQQLKDAKRWTVHVTRGKKRLKIAYRRKDP